MKIYKIGIIGYGGFGQFLHHWWAKLENVQVVAIADSKAKMGAVDGARIYRHWEELVEDADVDIVSIVTPPSVHAEIAVAAMLAGKDVLVEKPVAISKAQAQGILEVRMETGRSIMVNHMLRYTPVIREMIGIAKSGKLGKLRHAQVANFAQDASLPKEHWFWNRDFSGGIMIEHGVHFFDLINSMTTEVPIRVVGDSHFRNPVQQDQVAATVVYDQGLIAQHYHSFSGPSFFEQTTIRLTFDLARIEIQGWIPMSGKVTALTNNDSLELLERLPGWELLDCVQLSDGLEQPDVDTTGEAPSHLVNAGGIDYMVNKHLTGRFSTPGTKSE
ncbi:MAG: Gfo/Idh/MocA family oxidoreductase, partial [Chitinophagaceae bacterium]